MKLVGKVKDAHGLRGEILILVFSHEASWAKDLKNFFLNSDQNVFRVASIRPHKDGLILKAQEISDRTQAEKWVGALFYIDESLLISQPGETIFLSEIQDFELRSPQDQLLGLIRGFSSNGPQDLLVIEHEGQQSLVPFVAPWIQEIQFAQKRVVMDLPEGLFEVNAK